VGALSAIKDSDGFVVYPGIIRHYVTLPTRVEIYCVKKISQFDRTGLEPKDLTQKHPETLDILAVLTLCLLRYYDANKQDPDDPIIKIIFNKLKSVPLIYINFMCLKPPIRYRISTNFIVYPRNGIAITDDLSKIYKAGGKNIDTIKPTEIYDILWHAPIGLASCIKKENASIFEDMLDAIISLQNERVYSNIKPWMDDAAITPIIKKFRNSIILDERINSLFTQFVESDKMMKMFEYKSNLAFMSIEYSLRKEMIELINDGTYSEAVIRLKLTPEFNIIHVHLIKNFSIYRDLIKHYLTIPWKKENLKSLMYYYN
jgi:hypothetical protein